MVVVAFASERHYWRHLAPIVERLVASGVVMDATAHRDDPRLSEADLVLVAGVLDAEALRTRRMVYVEHGAGQSYQGVERGYAGSAGLDHVELFIAPSERVAARWRASYPQARALACGSPALDRYSGSLPRGQAVAFTWHWNCQLVPETRTALFHYARSLAAPVAALRSEGIEVLGSAHPRIVDRATAIYRHLGVEFLSEPEEILDRAGLLIADNTSLLYEAAALDIPTLALNAPFYRRSAQHGLRFWDAIPGLSVDEPADLLASIGRALDDPPEARALRAAGATSAYAALDGQASERAAAAILELL